MIRLIKALGKLIVRLYFIEARRLHAKARTEAKLAQEMALRTRRLSEASIAHTDEAAEVAARAQDLSKYF